MTKNLKPDLVFYILSVAQSLASIMVVILTVFYVPAVKMGLLQLVLVGTVLVASYFFMMVSEIKTKI